MQRETKSNSDRYFCNVESLGQLRAVFGAARNLIRNDRIDGLLQGVQATTIEELLEQADDFVRKNYKVAAAVVAGGALETHLRHLCERNGLTVTGPGSLETYNQAIGAARNNGNDILSQTQSKLITAWGGIRNEAAHDPGSFEHDADTVRAMIQGVRGLLAFS